MVPNMKSKNDIEARIKTYAYSLLTEKETSKEIDTLWILDHGSNSNQTFLNCYPYLFVFYDKKETLSP